MKAFITTALVFCFVVCLAATIADLSGKWTGTVRTPDGNDLQLHYVFKVDGDKLTELARVMANLTQLLKAK